MEELQKFRDAINPFLTTWKVVEVKAVADLDMGALLSMVACLSPDDPKPREVTDPIQGIAFIRQAFPISELNKMLDGWEQAAITLGSYVLSTSEFSRVQFLDMTSATEDLVLGWPEFRTYRQFELLSHGSKSLEALVKPRDTAAIARVLGFASFNELSMHRVQFQIGSAYGTRIEIFAPVLAVIEPRAETANVECSIRIHQALQTDDLCLSYRVQDQGGTRLAGGRILVSDFRKTASEYFNVLESSIALPLGSTSGELHLLHKLYRSQTEPIASAFFTVPPTVGAANPRWDLVLSIISNTRKWTKGGIDSEEAIKQWLGLTQPRPEQHEFERGVAILLFSAGVPVLPMGEAEGVDQVVMVSEPGQAAVVISCTTSPDVGNKISTLEMQRNRVKDKLSNFSVHAAIFAPVERRDLRLGDMQDCQDKDINLVLRPELQVLFDQVRGINWGQAADIIIRTAIRSRFPPMYT